MIAKDMGQDYSADMCSQKWRNLKKTFRSYEDNKHKTGEARKAVPQFYSEIEIILSGDHTVHPIALRDTTGLHNVPEKTGGICHTQL